jgi:hypothetical protein
VGDIAPTIQNKQPAETVAQYLSYMETNQPTYSASAAPFNAEEEISRAAAALDRSPTADGAGPSLMDLAAQ